MSNSELVVSDKSEPEGFVKRECAPASQAAPAEIVSASERIVSEKTEPEGFARPNGRRAVGVPRRSQ